MSMELGGYYYLFVMPIVQIYAEVNENHSYRRITSKDSKGQYEQYCPAVCSLGQSHTMCRYFGKKTSTGLVLVFETLITRD